MVRDAAPSTDRVWVFTHSRNRPKSSRRVGWPCSSSPFQAPLIASHSSTVRAVRTERALVRARVRQAVIDEALSGAKARYSRTDFSVGARPSALGAPAEA